VFCRERTKLREIRRVLRVADFVFLCPHLPVVIPNRG
jgi:hypothetical protein